jgi:hypothetical protein
MSTIWKSVVVSLTLMTAMLCFSATASADWQGAVWGMSLEDVGKSFRIPHRKPRPGEIFDPKAKLVFDTYATGNIVFEGGVLDFEDGGLVQIRMQLKWPDQCDSLSEALSRIHGKPANDATFGQSPRGGFWGHNTEWIDEKRNNRIVLSNAWNFRCEIFYTRLDRPRPVNAPPTKLTPAAGGL